MPTNARIKANRNNAKKSTGPRTQEGKTRSAKNALKHGLLARDTVMPGEDPADFDRQLSALDADIQPGNSLEFELVRQIADAQWRMRRLTRLETGFLAAAVDDQRRHLEKRRPDELRPGYDGETLLLGSAMLDRTQAFVHLARYDGHLSRRFFRAVKQLSDLRDAQHKRDASSTYENSHTPADPDPHRGRYVPAQAPPPIDPPRPTAGPIGFRASRDSAPEASLTGGRAPAPQPPLTQTTKQTQFRRTPVESTPFKDEPRSADLAFEIRGLCSAPFTIDSTRPAGAASPHRARNQDSRRLKASDSFVAHALSVPRRDSSRRPPQFGHPSFTNSPETTKQTQFGRTAIETTTSRPTEPVSRRLSRVPTGPHRRPDARGLGEATTSRPGR